MSEYALKVSDVNHWYGNNRVLHNINLDIYPGQIVAVVGPSGCGKSTLLKAILGTHPARSGKILADGNEVLTPSRDVGIVYQNYSLYDFLTAEENVAFGLKLDETSLMYRIFKYFSYRKIRAEHLRKSREFLKKVGLEPAAKLYPAELSGGMRQRVAIAQALIMKPKVLLLDEPFGALDEAVRQELQVMLLRLYQENLTAKAEGRRPDYTIIIVTHELNEAIYVADRVIGLSRYHTESAQGASVVYDKPCPVFHPDDTRDYEKFAAQREELRKAVFDPNYIKAADAYVVQYSPPIPPAGLAEQSEAAKPTETR